MISFNVPRGSHLKGLLLSISKSTKVRKFTLRYWLGGRSHEYHLGAYRPYKNSNDLGFTCVQVNKKQYDIYNDHTNDKGLYITSPKVADKIKETKITNNHQIEVLDSLTLRDVIVLICEAGFPKYEIDGAFLSRIHLAYIFKFLAGYNWKAKHIRFGDDTKGNGIITFKVNPNFSRFNDKIKDPYFIQRFV
ncbi:MAG: hypothetical protein HQ490_05615 [Lutibacter sp.]|nr:hypothetical protein [Lutibacter sp.]